MNESIIDQNQSSSIINIIDHQYFDHRVNNYQSISHRSFSVGCVWVLAEPLPFHVKVNK